MYEYIENKIPLAIPNSPPGTNNKVTMTKKIVETTMFNIAGLHGYYKLVD